MTRGDPSGRYRMATHRREIKNHPLLKGVKVPRTGSESRAGILVTKTLLFAGEGYRGQPMFRAYVKTAGQIIAFSLEGK